MVCVYWTWQQ